MNPGRVLFRRDALRVLAAMLLAAALAPSAFAIAPPPQPFAVAYELRHNSMLLARMERTLRPGENGTYVYESRSTPAGLFSAIRRDRVVESSVWDFVGERPRPLHYEYHHTGRGADRHVELDFDWHTGTVVNTINDLPWSMRVPDSVQDKLLYQYTMMRDLQNGESELAYEVADGGELKTYRFDLLGRETLKTPLGRLETVKLQRVSGDRRTVIWCAPQYGYMPVRVEQHRDRNVVTLTVSAIRME